MVKLLGGGLAGALPGQVENNLGGRLGGDGLAILLEPVNNWRNIQ